ncbi:MAG: hypothetical protein MI725_10100 [Pirellulales bacterium]|nr:hypothetical protein [Pirellulales bacterium]
MLSRLEHDRAVQVLSRLSTELQAEVLSRLAVLDTTDPQSLHVVESQLAQWIDAQQQQQDRMAAGVNLVQSILSNAPKRKTVLEKINRHNPELAVCLQLDSDSDKNLSAETVQEAPPKSSDFYNYNSPSTPRRIFSGGLHDTPSAAEPPSANPLAILEQADDEALRAAMSQADQRVISLALVGASEALLKRILSGLPRRQAKQFRKQLRSIGPARLSEMVAAQQELVRHVQLSLPQG